MTIKKIIASMAMLSILATITFSVNAAAITVDGVSYDGSNTITVTDADVDFTGDLVTTLRVVDEDGATVSGIDDSDVAEANGSFTVDVTAESGTLATDGIYSLSFVTAGGSFAAATFTVNNADQISVSANVLPILSMKVAGNIDFGDLVIDTVSTSATTTDVTVNTNAASGYNVQVLNVGLIDTVSSSYQIPNTASDEDLRDVTGTGYGFGINATVTAGDTIDSKTSASATIDGAFDGTDESAVSGMSTSAADLVSATGPVSNQVTSVTYYSRISALQETGTYADTVTYSITGSF